VIASSSRASRTETRACAARGPGGDATTRTAAGLFSTGCIVHSMLTNVSRLAVLTRLGRALADPSRARILAALADGVTYPAELATTLEMSRSNVSNHLACLRGCGLVVAELEGRRTRYAIADPHLTHALGSLVDVVLAVDEGEPCTSGTCAVPGCCSACEPADADPTGSTAAPGSTVVVGLLA